MTRLKRMVWLCALLLVACAGTAPNILTVTTGQGAVSSRQEEINNRWLARTLSFGEVTVRPLGLGSSMEAQVMVQNTTMGDVFFEYRFLWYDSSGKELSSISSWMPATLGGRDSRAFKSTAPGPDAVSLKFMVRYMHPVTHTGS